MQDMITQLKQAIAEQMASEGQILIAIDGNCTAGKTTLANLLSQHYACNVFHMDDFFLRPEQRIPQRYALVGGNVDYERFQEEVLIPLKAGIPFSYHPFDCKTLTLTQPVEVLPKRLNIIEGTYSHHPFFGEPYDLKIFLQVSPELQRQRILERPEHLRQNFFEKWIPMEQQYLERLSICTKADLVFTPTK